jgi:Putative Ig domain
MRKSLTPVMLIALLLVLTHPLLVRAQVTIAESGWTLVRTIPFTGAHAAHYNPVDGRIYVGRNGPVPTDNGIFRINADGSATKVGSTGTVGGVAIDPRDGDIFFSFPIIIAAIYRTPFGMTGGTAAERWVSVISPTGADTDPEGLAIAPPTYQGTVVQPGDAIAVDVGHDNPEHVWRFSADTRQEPVRLHVDNGTLVEPWDVTIGRTDIYIADAGPPGRIYRLDPGDSLVRFSPPILAPAGIVEDPVKGDLLVLDIASPARVVRYNPATGAVTDLLIGLAGPRHAGIDISPDGEVLVVTDRTANRIYVFQRNVGPLRIVTTELATDVVGVFSSQTLEAEFGAPPYVWTLAAGALPSGMTLESDGTLHGTPTTAGTFALTVRVTDSAGTAVDATFEKVVQVTASPPEIRGSKIGTRPVPGRILSYFILVENRGTVEATDLRVTEYLEPWFYLAGAQPWPDQLTIVDLPVANTGETLPLVEHMTWVLPALAPGSFQILRYDVALNASTPLGFEVEGQACPERFHSTPEAVACWDKFDKLSNSGREDCIQAMDAIGDVSDALIIGNYARKLATGSADRLALLRAANALAKSGVRSPITKVDGVKACITSLGEVLRAQLRQCLRGSDLEPNPCWTDKKNIEAPVDPNEKVVLPPGFIQPDQRLHYVVHFENVSDNVEAQDVFVTDTLDAHVDVTSLHVMTPAGDTLPLVPGETVTIFERTKTRSVVVGDTVQEIEVLEQWTASLASATRTLSWALRNIGCDRSIPQALCRLFLMLSDVSRFELGEGHRF